MSRPGWLAAPTDRRRTVIAASMAALLVACGDPPPREPDDLCAIFTEKRTWYRSAQRSRERWRLPEPVLLAVIHQESSFRSGARPPRSRILWIVPWRRPSSASGFGQVLDGTWEDYRQSTGNKRAKRDDFASVADFVGWYAEQIERRTGIAKDDPRRLYLAYHEGPAGFLRGSHRAKPALLATARQVESRAHRYARQYALCAERLAAPRRWPLWLVAGAAVALLFWLAWQRRRRARR